MNSKVVNRGKNFTEREKSLLLSIVEKLCHFTIVTIFFLPLGGSYRTTLAALACLAGVIYMFPSVIVTRKNIPVRVNIGVMMFLATFMNYMMRVNMSVNIIAMVNNQASNGTSIKTQCQEVTNYTLSYEEYNTNIGQDARRQPPNVVTFDWTEQQQAYVLSAYFWGYAAGCLPGGTVAERWGTRKVVFFTMLIVTVLNLLCPLAARLGYLVLAGIRVISGVAAGFLLPALHVLVAHWVPPNEKGKFVSATLGGAIGTVFTWSLTGPLIENFGWDYAFYVPGAIALCWCLLWWYSIYDVPADHPSISEAEKQYIQNAIGERVRHSHLKTKGKTPLRQIFTSFPYLALVILHFGSNWGFYFIMTAAPKYMSSALGFNLSASGALASLPYLLRMSASIVFGHLGDRLLVSKIVSVNFIRKFFCIFSHIVPGILLMSMGYVGCSPYLSVAVMSLALGSNGAATLTNLMNHQDLAPNYAGTLFGIANGIGNISGFITPLVTAYFTKNGNGFAEWRPVFLTGAVFYIATAIYFIIFGTVETQPWNTIAEEKEDKSKSDTTKEATVITTMK